MATRLLSLACLLLSARALETAPAVGVLMLPSEFSVFPYESNYAMVEVIKWVTQHHMRWFPIYLTDTSQLLRKKVSDADLILLTGGDIEMYDPKYPDEKRLTRYAKTVKFIVETAKTLTRKGHPKPIYGICLGFQSLVLAMTDWEVPFNDDFANVQQQQKVFFDLEKDSLWNQVFTKEELKSFGETPYFWHSYNHGFTLENALKTESFKENFEILSTSVTLKGVRVVSAVRARDFPFYGNLFHPEHAQFSITESDPFEWGDDSLRVNYRVGKILKKLIGRVRAASDNKTLVEYRKYLRHGWDLEQRDVFMLIDVPIHGRTN